MLDLVLMRAADRGALAAYVEARLQRRLPAELQLDVRRGRRITLRPTAGVRWHCDDDLADESLGVERLTVVAGNGVDVLVPSERPPGGSGRSSSGGS
jgi:hypothetical protein